MYPGIIPGVVAGCLLRSSVRLWGDARRAGPFASVGSLRRVSSTMRAVGVCVAGANGLLGVGLAGLSGWCAGPPMDDNEDVIAGPGLPATAETVFRAVAAAADALYVADVAGRIAFLNPAALKILGYRDADELLGRSSHETIHYLRPDGSLFPAAECALLRPSQTGETLQFEQDSLVRKDGTQVAVSYSSAPVDLVDGRGVIVAFRDISARVQLGEVEASRTRIAKAADDARREIERDLHDGAQQQFVAVAMRLENARRLIQTDPADAARLVDAVHADLREAIAELRRLAHGIHPAELSRRGLIAALRTLARRAAIPVDLKAEDVGRLPPQIEATAYYIAAEATANAVKHANADHLQIVLVRTAGTLRLTITDDGAGGAAPARGTGLQGLRDRADAAAGHLTLDSPDRGPTIVTAELPIPG
jgi:PAS domain S-box-containing protein